MRLPHNVIREWWHQPVLDRLDAIERNTRPQAVAVKPTAQIHVEPSTTPSELAKAIRWEVRACRPRTPATTHGICGWCEQTVELVINNGLVWLSDHANKGRTCFGSGSEDYQPAKPEAVS